MENLRGVKGVQNVKKNTEEFRESCSSKVKKECSCGRKVTGKTDKGFLFLLNWQEKMMKEMWSGW